MYSVGQVNEEQILYLMSRGLSADAARGDSKGLVRRIIELCLTQQSKIDFPILREK
jgi:Fe-S cluster assembly scaffold protein SufB